MRPRYSSRDVGRLRSFLERQGTLEFPVLPTGLFSAARLSEGAEYTGYDNVWVRDNVHIAHAHAVTGRAGVACRTLGALRRTSRDTAAASWRSSGVRPIRATQ